jgi:hypothetical protein
MKNAIQAKIYAETKDDPEFEKLFGTWESNLSAEEQVAELRAARSQIFHPRVYPRKSV